MMVEPFAVLLFINVIIAILKNIFIEEDKQVEAWVNHMLKTTPKVLLASFLIAVPFTVAQIPNLLIKSNIARIEIRYTDMETVKELETGAKELGKKLDRLIDAGIKRIEEKPEQ
jgi:DNA-directed RNA polymerase subunit L